MRPIAVCFLLVLPLLGQYETISTNDDGSVVNFTTKLRQRGTNQNSFHKVFVADTTGVRLVLQRARETRSDPTSAWPVTTYYSLEAVDTTGDASTRAVQARRDCGGGSGCLNVVKWQTEIITGGGTVQTIKGRAVLSRNGRYALTCCDGTMTSYSAELLDLETGARRSSGSDHSQPLARRSVSSNGVAVVPRFDSIMLMTTAEARTLTPSRTPVSCTLDDTGSSLACDLIEAPGLFRLVRIDPQTGVETPVATSTAHTRPALSADGRVLVYLRDGRLFTEQRQLPAFATPITQFALSGDGRVVWAATASGMLVRIDIENHTATAVIHSAIQIHAPVENAGSQPVAGSQFRLQGYGFQQGASVTVGGRTAPVIAVTPSELTFQIPWNSAGPQELTVTNPQPSFFDEERPTITVRASYPQFFKNTQDEPLAVHADWDALVTRERPARPGEIIHLFMTGLGPVEERIPEGTPAPTDRAISLTQPLACRFSGTSARILFAGLLPGAIGLYQVDLKIPDEVELFGPYSNLFCHDSNSLGESASLPTSPAP